MKVVMMIGVPGSGKSTWSNKIEKAAGEKALILSSDDIREEVRETVHDENMVNVETFARRDKQLEKAVKSSSHDIIVLDSTNLSRKRRRSLYNNIKRWDKTVEVEAFVVLETLNTLITRNYIRELKRQVPIDVVERMYKNLQVPRLDVDCDSIRVETSHEWFDKDFDPAKVDTVWELIDMSSLQLNAEIGKIIDMSHDCAPYHLESVSDHIDMMMNHRYVKTVESMRPIALFHDLGKVVTKEIHDNGVATYRNHANVGAMYYLAYLAQTDYVEYFGQPSSKELHQLEVIYQHMNGHQGLGKKNVKRNKIERLVKTIEIFNKIDKDSRVVGKLEVVKE